ncbi:putative Glycosyl transferase, group 1 family protein [Tenacibaculum litopenaei]|uniref:glycosyltransferase family 4 protein n=1 Tax=Tenacibaculum litopenaei TaxID=396016 RepID=UPI00389530D9
MEGNRKKKVLLIGPLPPPIGGTTVSFDYLVKATDKINSFEFKVVNLKLSENRLKNILLQVFLLLRIISLIFTHDIISFHANPRRIAVWGPIFLRIAKLLGKKIQFRFFGSDLDLFYKESNVNELLIHKLKAADQILLQTKGLIKFWREHLKTEDNVHWFATSRPIAIESVEKRVNEVVRFVYAGHVKEEKGIKVLLDAFKQLDHEEQVILDIYGKCTDAELESRMRNMERVNYIGEVTADVIRKQLFTYDAFLFPSFWKGEGYPGALIEAMQAGLPIVSTDWRYLTELVEHDYNGLLIEPQNIPDLVKAMTYLIEKPNKREEYGKNSKTFVKKFDSDEWNYRVFESLLRKF